MDFVDTPRRTEISRTTPRMDLIYNRRPSVILIIYYLQL